MPNRRPTLTPSRTFTAAVTFIWAVSLVAPGDILRFYPPVLDRTFNPDWSLGLLFLFSLGLQNGKLLFPNRFHWNVTIFGSAFACALWLMLAVTLIAWRPGSGGGWMYLCVALLQIWVLYEAKREQAHLSIPTEIL